MPYSVMILIIFAVACIFTTSSVSQDFIEDDRTDSTLVTPDSALLKTPDSLSCLQPHSNSGSLDSPKRRRKLCPRGFTATPPPQTETKSTDPQSAMRTPDDSTMRTTPNSVDDKNPNSDRKAANSPRSDDHSCRQDTPYPPQRLSFPMDPPQTVPKWRLFNEKNYDLTQSEHTNNGSMNHKSGEFRSAESHHSHSESEDNSEPVMKVPFPKKHHIHSPDIIHEDVPGLESSDEGEEGPEDRCKTCNAPFGGSLRVQYGHEGIQDLVLQMVANAVQPLNRKRKVGDGYDEGVYGTCGIQQDAEYAQDNSPTSRYLKLEEQNRMEAPPAVTGSSGNGLNGEDDQDPLARGGSIDVPSSDSTENSNSNTDTVSHLNMPFNAPSAKNKQERDEGSGVPIGVVVSIVAGAMLLLGGTAFVMYRELGASHWKFGHYGSRNRQEREDSEVSEGQKPTKAVKLKIKSIDI